VKKERKKLWEDVEKDNNVDKDGKGKWQRFVCLGEREKEIERE
jgi:hypothetical protein